MINGVYFTSNKSICLYKTSSLFPITIFYRISTPIRRNVCNLGPLISFFKFCFISIQSPFILKPFQQSIEVFIKISKGFYQPTIAFINYSMPFPAYNGKCLRELDGQLFKYGISNCKLGFFCSFFVPKSIGSKVHFCFVILFDLAFGLASLTFFHVIIFYTAYF